MLPPLACPWQIHIEQTCGLANTDLSSRCVSTANAPNFAHGEDLGDTFILIKLAGRRPQQMRTLPAVWQLVLHSVIAHALAFHRRRVEPFHDRTHSDQSEALKFGGTLITLREPAGRTPAFSFALSETHASSVIWCDRLRP